MKKRAVLSMVLVVLFLSLAGCEDLPEPPSPLPTPRPESFSVSVETPADTPPMEDPDVPSLTAALTMLATGLGAFSAGGVVSYLLNKWPWYCRQARELKHSLVVGLAVLLSILARLALEFVPAQVWVVIEPYWQIAAGAVMLYFGSQVTYTWQKLRSK